MLCFSIYRLQSQENWSNWIIAIFFSLKISCEWRPTGRRCSCSFFWQEGKFSSRNESFYYYPTWPPSERCVLFLLLFFFIKRHVDILPLGVYSLVFRLFLLCVFWCGTRKINRQENNNERLRENLFVRAWHNNNQLQVVTHHQNTTTGSKVG